VLADPALVILDEATAEAESADDDQLNAAAQAAIAGRAALVIAQGSYANLWAAWSQQL